MVKTGNLSASSKGGGKIPFKRRAMSSVIATTMVVGMMPSLAWATPQEVAEDSIAPVQIQEVAEGTSSSVPAISAADEQASASSDSAEVGAADQEKAPLGTLDTASAIEAAGTQSAKASAADEGESTADPQYTGVWDGEAAAAWTNGTGTAEDPFLIENAANLVYLAQQVNASSSQHYAGKYFKLTTDLDMSAGNMPSIGKDASNYFSGVFDGDGHTITVKMSASSNYLALFGALSAAGYSAPSVYPELKNIVLAGSITNEYASAASTAGFVGFCKYGKISNCRNEASISNTGSSTSTQNLGGIVATLGSYDPVLYVSNCSNTGALSSASTASYVGGIVGNKIAYSKAVIENCYNIASLTSGKYVGGILGNGNYGTSATYTTTVANCYNSGALTGDYVGGIVGNFVTPSSNYSDYSKYNTFTNCYWENSVANYYGTTAAPSSYGCSATNVQAVAANAMNTADFVATLGDAYLVGSNHALLSWEAPAGVPVFAPQPEGAAYVKGAPANALSVAATTTSGEAISYQWYKATAADLSDAVALEGETQTTYTPETAELGTAYYYCVATVNTSELSLFPAMSAAAEVRVWSGKAAVAPAITAQPQNATAGQGETTAVLSVTAAFAGEGESDANCVLSYQWQVSDAADGEFTDIQGATDAEYTADASDLGTKYYRCVVTNTREGEATASATSEAASVEITGRVISTAEQLLAFAQEVNAGDSKEGFTISLGADIDATQIDMVPIGISNAKSFKGTFDGAGHAITLNMTTNGSQYAGLFGYTTKATVENLTIKGSLSFTFSPATSYTAGNFGAIIGYGNNTTVLRNCTNEASVSLNYTGTSTSTYCGGLIGYTFGGSGAASSVIENCANKGAIDAQGATVGGVYGNALGVRVTNCYNTGSVKGGGDKLSTGGCVGGFSGLLNAMSSSATVIENCYSAGKVSAYSANAKLGVMWGDNTSKTPVTTNCYYDADINGDLAYCAFSGTNHSAVATGLTTSEMKAAASLLSGELDPAPFVDEASAQNGGYPILAREQASAPEITYVAQVGGQSYETLSEAVAAAAAAGTAEAPATVTLLSNCAGSGIIIPENSHVTIDFAGFSYTVERAPLAGSTGSQNQAFQLLKGSTIVMKGGTIAVDQAVSAAARMIVQNYADLTLENMVLDGTNLACATEPAVYTLSNNSGTVNLTGATSIKASTAADKTAYGFDTCKFASYVIPQVTVDTTGTIEGIVSADGGKLAIKGGMFTGSFEYTSAYAAGDVVITGGAFAAEPAQEALAAGYVAQKQADETYSVAQAIKLNAVTVSEGQYAVSRASDSFVALHLVTLDADVVMEGYVPTLDGAALAKKGDQWMALSTAANLSVADFDVAQAAAVEVVAGDTDVNNSGRSNIVDAQVAYDMAKGNYTFGAAGVLNLKSWLVADVNADGAIDSADAFAIQYKLHYGDTQ